MKTIILDTNFIVQCLANKVDLFSELDRICDFKYKLAMVDKSGLELDTVALRGDADERVGAKLAKQLIAKGRIETIKTTQDKHVDALILDLVDENTIVATQDQDFKRKLKFKKVPMIVIRQLKYLELA